MSKGTILLAAGGTGGHLFPAQALAEVLVRRGYDVQLATDERVRDYGKSFPASKVHVIKSATLSLGSPAKLPDNVFTLGKAYLASRRMIADVRPLAIAGFGGYPSLAPLLAAAHKGVPSLVHEQNAVLGRANGFLAKHVRRVASSFPSLRNLPEAAESKLVFTGNPVRSLVLKQQAAAFPATNEKLNLLIFGGSQGARFFSEFMPQVFTAMDDAQRKCFHIVQQAREEDAADLSKSYSDLGMVAEVSPFFADLPKRMADAHLVISRSGASTIAELGVVGRPALLVPLPHAIDNDQLRNAEFFEKAGAGWCQPQASLVAKTFAAQLNDLLGNPARLQAAAAQALAIGKPDAAQRLADFLENMLGAAAPQGN
jgi:UDP-N-acetylglucosamine--N-acetylmuramyl-(pentapeptide) pyrophosphoryl-undecaprenol N-acetylglucosamine transferase